jgi:hypothetical protein
VHRTSRPRGWMPGETLRIMHELQWKRDFKKSQQLKKKEKIKHKSPAFAQIGTDLTLKDGANQSTRKALFPLFPFLRQTDGRRFSAAKVNAPKLLFQPIWAEYAPKSVLRRLH